MITASPELTRLTNERDIAILRHLEAVKPEGPREAEQIAKTIAVIRKRLEQFDDRWVTP